VAVFAAGRDGTTDDNNEALTRSHGAVRGPIEFNVSSIAPAAQQSHRPGGPEAVATVCAEI